MKKVDDSTLLSLCLSGKSQADIARQLSMTTTQVCRRINDRNFQSMLSEYRKKTIDSIFTELTASAQKSVQTLTELLDHKNGYIALSAATQILKLCAEYSVQVDIMADIERLKALKEIEASNEATYNILQ